LREEHESLSRERERELLEVQSELERVRVERHEWEQVAMREKVEGADALTLVETLRRDLDLERRAREREGAELESERERAVNLQSVLEDFQAGRRFCALSQIFCTKRKLKPFTLSQGP
jgi:hypothetical protein